MRLGVLQKAEHHPWDLGRPGNRPRRQEAGKRYSVARAPNFLTKRYLDLNWLALQEITAFGVLPQMHNKEWAQVQGGRLRALTAYTVRMARRSQGARTSKLQALKDLILEIIED